MELDIKRVIASTPKEHEPDMLRPLSTVWGDALDPDHVLEEHPRPQMRRDDYTTLNGWWDFSVVSAGSQQAASLGWHDPLPPERYTERIVVPFSPESQLSQVARTIQPSEFMWYRRTLPFGRPEPGMRRILHFEAVDYACAVYINGIPVGRHEGGYLPFSFDISEVLREGQNVLELCAWDPSEHDVHLRGKQRIERDNMWYTAQSGIWQTVWTELTPSTHIENLSLVPDADAGKLDVLVDVTAGGAELCVRVLDHEGAPVAEHSGLVPIDAAVGVVTLTLYEPHLWSPDDPYLYNVEIRYGDDIIKSYVAFRTIQVGIGHGGTPRIFLNHEEILLKGVLDQGYWPDGLMSAPSDEALIFDIEAMRGLGFNMLRKHIKVERDRWYYHCDRLGMMVWQDMVSGGGPTNFEWVTRNPTLSRKLWSNFNDETWSHHRATSADNPAYREEWEQSMKETIRHLRNHPSIIVWNLFNEGWGQFCSVEMERAARKVDSTRPICAASGWFDQGVGDLHAVHNYFRSMAVYPEVTKARLRRSRRAFVISECGGLVLRIPHHSSIERTYGYDTYTDPEVWVDAVHALTAEIEALEVDGLCGFVYTQLSDIEEETNGLLTYDRRINKMCDAHEHC